jgi:uncharacterized protein
MSRDSGPGYLPEQVPIDVYGNGGFRFADMSHRGSLLCLPSGLHAWDMEEGRAFQASDFEKVLAEAEAIKFLLVGTGLSIRPLPAAIRTMFKDAGISCDPMSTGAAIRTYNIMLVEKRPVAAALIAV